MVPKIYTFKADFFPKQGLEVNIPKKVLFAVVEVNKVWCTYLCT